MIHFVRGDAARLPLADSSAHACVTSPPYYKLRRYLKPGESGEAFELGREPTPEMYVERLVAVFREVKRCLHPSGVLLLNIGDSYRKGRRHMGSGKNNEHSAWGNKTGFGTKPKDLLGIPWMVAFALRSDGWYLRSDIVWHKPNGMPSSVRDRPGSAHEYVFLLSKSPRYFWDNEAIRVPSKTAAATGVPVVSGTRKNLRHGTESRHRSRVSGGQSMEANPGATAMPRSVWSLTTEPSPYKHYAAMPTKLARRCVLAATSDAGVCPECWSPWQRIVERKRTRTRPGVASKINGIDLGEITGRLDTITGYRDTGRHVTEVETLGWEPSCPCGHDRTRPAVVLDPFGGIGTTGVAAEALGRDSVICELGWEYLGMAKERAERPHKPKPRSRPSPERHPLLDAMVSPNPSLVEPPRRKPLPGQLEMF